jgi:hypothetical protein
MAGVVGAILLLVGVLVVTMCIYGLVRRRGKRNRATHHKHSVVQDRGVEDHGCNKTQLPEEQQLDNFNTGGFYDEVEVKIQPAPFPVPSEYQLVEGDGDVVMTTVQGDTENEGSPTCNPEDLYAQPDKKSKNKKENEKESNVPNVHDPEMLYAVVDKSKKTKVRDSYTTEPNPVMSEKMGCQETGPEHTPPFNVDNLYAQVDKTKKNS